MPASLVITIDRKKHKSTNSLIHTHSSRVPISHFCKVYQNTNSLQSATIGIKQKRSQEGVLKIDINKISLSGLTQ